MQFEKVIELVVAASTNPVVNFVFTLAVNQVLEVEKAMEAMKFGVVNELVWKKAGLNAPTSQRRIRDFEMMVCFVM